MRRTGRLSYRGDIVMTMSNDMVTRAAAAQALDCSPSTVLRRERAGLLEPVRSPGDRTVRYRRAQVESLRTPGGASTAGELDGEGVATAFDLLEGGASPADVVRRLRLLPHVVDGIVECWAKMRRTVLSLNSNELHSVLAAIGAADVPVHTASDLVAAIRGQGNSGPSSAASGVENGRSDTHAAVEPGGVEAAAAPAVAASDDGIDLDYLREAAERLQTSFPILASGIRGGLAGYESGTMRREVLIGLERNWARRFLPDADLADGSSAPEK